ncbi:hypothetical protein D7I47_05055 [Protaetiibacter intestinalis]|uniref:Uncharacterized protein n=1 Tax=Protaetiibacter intestinalis TaxID=2419774 RepID=A0A387B5K0_9MICO|nr:hypothetical protein D7I47_05055 [Protaetiibacter intestinalis]
MGILIAASVAAAAALKDLDEPGRMGINVAAFALLGMITPVVVACAFGIWLGELFRMERAGHFLRERELAWSRGRAASADPSDPTNSDILLWESLLAAPVDTGAYAKNRLGGMASIALFAALAGAALAAGIVIAIGPGGMLGHIADQAAQGWVHGAIWAWAGVFVLVNLLVFVPPVRSLGGGRLPEKNRLARA